MGWAECSRVASKGKSLPVLYHLLPRPFFLGLAYGLNGRPSLRQPLPCCQLAPFRNWQCPACVDQETNKSNKPAMGYSDYGLRLITLQCPKLPDCKLWPSPFCRFCCRVCLGND